ncbi:MAG: fatty acid desaturase [Planctomycetes bacterium]|nr:fatty acid desaturase [Planctomycetota bacterium]
MYTQFTAEEARAIDSKFTLPRFLCRPGGAIGWWFLAYPWPVDHWAVTAFWSLFTGYFLFCWTSCFHETVHQTLTSSKKVSIWLGRFLGMAMFVPYTAYRETHIRHHAYLNKPYDWELWPYASPSCSLGFRRVFVILDLLCGVITSPIIYGRIYFHPASPLRNPAVRRTIRNEYLGMLAFWGLVLGLIQYYHVWGGFVKAWLIPVMIASVLQTGRKLTEHLGMASFDPLQGTRTVLGKNWLTRFTTFVNFDIFIHGPHHRHPRVAHNLLAQKMNDYLEDNPGTDFPVYQHYWEATRAMLPFLFRNPGCGVNAGGQTPAQHDVDVQDFVADVNREVLARS